MNVFYSNDFEGFWPIGTAAVVVAKDEDEARKMIVAQHSPAGRKPFTIHQIDATEPRAIILCNGDY